MKYFQACKRRLTSRLLLCRFFIRYTCVLVFFFLGTGLMYSTVHGQNVNIKLTNVPLGEFLNQLKKQTGYDFIYEQQLVARAGTVSVALNGATFDQAMSSVLGTKI